MFKMTEFSTDFKIDPIGPLSYDSDEESFVVLGKSMVSDVDDTHMESNDQIAQKTIEEAKKIIGEEIKKISISGQGRTLEEFMGPKSSVLEVQNTLQNVNSSLHENIEVDSVEKKANSFLEMNGGFKELSISQDASTSKMSTACKTSSSSTSIPMNIFAEEKNKRNEIEQTSSVHVSTEKKEDVNSMSLEDLQKMIAEIVEENTKLRKTLEHNNIKMREQCVRITEWQNEVKKVHDAHKEKIVEAKEHIDKLTTEKNEAKNEALALQDELNLTRTKLAELQIMQTEMQQSRSSAFASMKALNAEVQRLQGIINELEQRESNDDKIYALEAQLELYKSDFEEERRAKESIRDEKEKMSEDMQNLQRRNQQLQERVDMICDKDFLMYEARREPRSSGSSTSEFQAVLKCPKCSNAFTDMSSLQNHCYVCIT